MSFSNIKKRISKDLRGIIPEFRNKSYNIEINELKSRKNAVFDIVFDKKPQDFPKEFIIKIFKTNNIVSENNILIRLKNQKFYVPEVLHLKKPYLILEKVHGVNLCDFINDNLGNSNQLEDLEPDMKNQIKYSVEKLAKWLSQLHGKNIVRHYESEEPLVLNKGDTRLRDFIINSSQDILYGVDFEDAYEGNHMDDLAWICCSLLDTDPGLFSMDEPKHKIDLINLFLRKYYQTNTSFQFDFNYLAEKLIELLNVVIVRRNLPFGPLKKTSFFDDISRKIN